MPSSTRIPAAETGQTARSSAVVVAILFAIVCLTWGTTWLGIKLAVDTVPPLLAAGLRFVIAFPLLYLIARAQRAPLLFPEGQGGLFVLIVILYFALPYLLINAGEQYVSSGLAALLFSTMPVFTVIFSVLILREPIWATQLVGVIVERPDVSQFSATSLGALVYLGTVASVGGFLAYFHLLKQLSPVVLSFVFLIFPVIAVILSGWLEHRGVSPAFAGYCVVLIAAFALTKLQIGRLSRARV